jgi:hypothetical protein
MNCPGEISRGLKVFPSNLSRSSSFSPRKSLVFEECDELLRGVIVQIKLVHIRDGGEGLREGEGGTRVR